MLLVLDSNEYIFALGVFKKHSCELLLEKILETATSNTIRIPRMIVEEVKNNLPPEAFREFINSISSLTSVDEDIMVPFEIGVKYESLGLKPADAFIGAYVEWVGADALVTENRHFLSRHANIHFKILTAESTLKILNK